MEAPAQEKRSVVASGKTVDDAIAHGLAMLGMRRDQVEIKVLSEGSRGILGLGAENARVEVKVKSLPSSPSVRTTKGGEATQPVVPLARGGAVESVVPGAALAPAPQPLPTIGEPAPRGSEADPGRLGQQLLSELLERMGIPAKVEVGSGTELAEEGQAPPIVLNITGGDLGILIGRRGETLLALQYLVRLMVSHRLKQWSDLVVDVEHYRIRRRRQLETLALSMAERVVREGRSVALEPMPAYERRVVHMVLRKHPKVTTQSVGEGERRKVTILPRR